MPPAADTHLDALIARALPDITAIRHDLHAHPELGYQEHRTAGIVVRELKRLNIPHVAGLAPEHPGKANGTGVVAFIPATEPDAKAEPSIAFRADMDALPIHETTGLPYASQTPGVMHACGHDGHTANLLGVARVLSELPHRPHNVTLIFQPAEEGGAGGKRMCEDGALDGSRIGTPVASIYGLHGWPLLELGVVGTRPGPLLAATDAINITITGEQTHAAYPHLGRDPVVCAAHVITALQTIASRTVSPTDAVVVTIATIHAGTARNVIPSEVQLLGTLRTLRASTRELARKRIREIVHGVCGAMGCQVKLELEEGYPVTVNHPATTHHFMDLARRTLGESRVVEVPEPSLGGEDFAFYGLHVPACFFVLGVCAKSQTAHPNLHQPNYNFADAALTTGMQLMCALALEPRI